MTQPLGSVDVEVTASLTVYDRAMSNAEQTAKVFEKTATEAFSNVEKASDAAGRATAEAMAAAGRESAAAGRAAADAGAMASEALNATASAADNAAKAADVAARVLNGEADAAENASWHTATLAERLAAFEAAQQKANKESAEAQKHLSAKAEEAKKAADADHKLAEAEKQAAADAKKMVDPIEDAADAMQDMASKAGHSEAALNKLGRAGGNIVGQIASGRMSIDGLSSSAISGGEALLALGGRIAVVGGLVAVAAAAVAAAVAAWWQYDASVRAVENTLQGLGRSTGMTAGEFQAVAAAGAEAANIHVGAAEKMAAAYVRMGVTNGEVIQSLISLTADYAAVTNQDLTAAQAQLGASFDDPIRGVDILNEKLNLLDADAAKLIVTLAQQGNTAEATTLLMDALTGSVGGQARNVNILAGAWRDATKAAKDYWTAFGRGVDVRLGGGTTADQLAAARKSENSFIGRLNDGVAGAFGAERPFRAHREQLEALHAQEQASAAAAKAEAERAAASRDAQASVEAALPWDRQRTEVTNRMARTQRDLNAGLITESQATRALAADRQRLRSIEEQSARNGAPRGRGGNNDRSASIRRQAAAMEENARQGIELAAAYLQNDEAALRAEASRKALTEATRRGTNVEAQYRRQLAISVADAAVTAAKATASAHQQAEAIQAVNDKVAAGTASYEEASRASKIDIALRPLMVAAAVAEGDAREALTKIIDAQREALKTLQGEEARGQALKSTEAIKNETDLIRLQTSLIGKNNDERRKALAIHQAMANLKAWGVDPNSAEGSAYVGASVDKAGAETSGELAAFNDNITRSIRDQIKAYQDETAVLGMTYEEALRYRREQELLNQAQAAGIPITDELRGRIEALAVGYATAGSEAKAAKDHFDAIKEASDFAGQSITDFFDGIIFGSASGEDALRNLVRTLGQAAHQAVTMGSGPLAGIFGTKESGGAFGGGQSGGGIFGSIFKSIFKVPVAHNGMNAGSMPARTRSVSPDMFLNAPRLHEGLAPDEFPAILQRGEEVVPKHGRRSGGGGITMVVNTPDANSFRRSERQIGRGMKRKLKL